MGESRLKALAPFAELSTAERKMLARMLDQLTAPAGAALVSQGDYGYEFMVIEEGTVDVYLDGERIDTIGPGDFFGSSPRAPGATRRSSPSHRRGCSR
jgi:CRP-like cAMP-binding protein